MTQELRETQEQQVRTEFDSSAAITKSEYEEILRVVRYLSGQHY